MVKLQMQMVSLLSWPQAEVAPQSICELLMRVHRAPACTHWDDETLRVKTISVHCMAIACIWLP